jgi:hypothetical protein
MMNRLSWNRSSHVQFVPSCRSSTRNQLSCLFFAEIGAEETRCIEYTESIVQAFLRQAAMSIFRQTALNIIMAEDESSSEVSFGVAGDWGHSDSQSN